MRRRTFLGAAASAGTLALAPGRWAFAAGSVSLPFDFDQDRRIMVPILIDGKPAQAWLDSGASASVVDLTFAHALGLPLGEEIRAAGVSNQVKGARLVSAELRIGAALLPRHPLAAIDLTEVSEQSPRPVQVILGRDLFDSAVLEIDFQSPRLTITLAEAFHPPAETPLPLSRAGALRAVPVNLDGVITPALFDLGNTGALIVDHVYAEEHGFMRGRRVSTQLGIGADGLHEDAVLSLARVELGGVRFHDVPAVAARRLAAQAPANVGLDLLSRFRLTVDFPRDRLWLHPYADAAKARFRKNRAGLFVRPDVDRLLVTHVSTGSPAAKGGWRAGDLIAAVDGRPVDGDFERGPLSHWSSGPAGQVVALTMADGSTRRLRLEDYY